MLNHITIKSLNPVLAAISLLAVFYATPLKAENSQASEEPPPSIKALEMFNAPRDIVSRQIVDFADWIDNFFAGDRVYDELQESYIKIYMIQTNRDNEKPVYNTKIKAKLVFPKTQKRLKLLIEDEDEDEDENEGTPQAAIADSTTESSQSVGLRFIQKESKLWRINTDVLVRYRSGFETTGRLRLRRREVFGSWITRLSEKITVNSVDGMKETTQLDIDHPFSDKYLFRSTTQATWKNINGYFNYGQDFLLFHNINKRKALTYQAGIRAITEGRPHTTDYILSMKYREQVHRGWVFYEIIPAINYPIEEDHKPLKSISLKLEIVFDSNDL